MNFETDKVKGILKLMSMPINSRTNTTRLEFNRRYLSKIVGVTLSKNEYGYPVVSVFLNVKLDNNATTNIAIKYSLAETTRYKKLNELKTLICALAISLEKLCSNSKTDEDIIINIVAALKENINKNFILVKEGKQSYYTYKAYSYVGENNNE